MSENEFMWWIARSVKKPLPSIREDINNARLTFFSMGNSGKPSDRPYRTWSRAIQDWYSIPDSENKDLQLYAAQMIAKNQENNNG